MLGSDGQTILGSFKFSQRWLGGEGWCIGGAASRDGMWHGCYSDVSPFIARRLTIDPAYTQILVPGKAPARTMGDWRALSTSFDDLVAGGYVPGRTFGGWHMGFGGPDATVCYITYLDGVYVSSDFDTGRNFAATDLIDVFVNPNVQTSSRTWMNKGATDPLNRNVYYIHMGKNGFYYTTNKVNFTKITHVPDPLATGNPYDPDCRWGMVALDEAGATIGSGGTLRKARVAVIPNGRGPYLSTDGMATSTSIKTGSGAGNFLSASCAVWISGKLYVTVVDAATMDYSSTVSTATGGAGNGLDNVRCYDPGAGTWSFVAHNMNGSGRAVLGWPQFIVADPRNAGAFFIWTNASEVAHFDGTSTWVYTGFANGGASHTFARIAPTDRPEVAQRMRLGQNFAISDGIVIPDPVTGLTDALLVMHTGGCPQATRLADWPTQNFVAGDSPLDAAKAPLWRERAAGYEAKVGQVPLFLGNRLWNGAQDVTLSLGEDGSRGHGAVVYSYPPTGGLGDAQDLARGPYKNFGICYRARSGGSALMMVSYTLDNITWQAAPHQITSTLGAYEPGSVACGANYSAIVLPGWNQDGSTTHVPSVYSDIRSSLPIPITFKRENGTTVPAVFNQGGSPASSSGFNTFNFTIIGKKVCIDPDNPSCYYFWNTGGSAAIDAGDPNGPTNPVYDPADYGGIYKMDLAAGGYNPAAPVAARVYTALVDSGHSNPCWMGNFGTFGAHMLIANGYMALSTNALADSAAYSSNRIVVLRMSDWQRRVITTGPGNCSAICLGDPLYGSVPCLWALGWSSASVFGLFVSHDWYVNATPTWQGPFNADMPNGGRIGRMDAHLAVEDEPKHFGRLGFAVQSRGMVYGQMQLGNAA